MLLTVVDPLTDCEPDKDGHAKPYTHANSNCDSVVNGNTDADSDPHSDANSDHDSDTITVRIAVDDAVVTSVAVAVPVDACQCIIPVVRFGFDFGVTCRTGRQYRGSGGLFQQ